ncbi:MAG: FliM/FliN family flagellar motor switch protein [Rhizobacter sp.]|nr:FliM/FliN family flagellar motor switch protein [Rhizobacter sp.]
MKTVDLRPSAEARPLHWWSDKTLAPLRTGVSNACSEWSARWGVSLACMDLINACERPDVAASWQRPGEQEVWLGIITGTLAGLLHEELFHTTVRPQTLAESVASRAADDLAAALSALFDATGSSLPEPAGRDLKPWSGAVRAKLALGARASTCWLHASPQAMSAHLRKATATGSRKAFPSSRLTPVLRAIAHESLSFKVELAPAELRLGELQSLQVGDVLTLPHGLETPLSVRPSDSDLDASPIGLAYLGARHGCRAIELLRTDNDLA